MHRVSLDLPPLRCRSRSDTLSRISSLQTFWLTGTLSLFFRWRLLSANLVFTSLILSLLFNSKMIFLQRAVSALGYLSLDGTLTKAIYDRIHANYEVTSHIVPWISGNSGIRLLAVVSKYASPLFSIRRISILIRLYYRRPFMISMPCSSKGGRRTL